MSEKRRKPKARKPVGDGVPDMWLVSDREIIAGLASRNAEDLFYLLHKMPEDLKKKVVAALELSLGESV